MFKLSRFPFVIVLSALFLFSCGKKQIAPQSGSVTDPTKLRVGLGPESSAKLASAFEAYSKKNPTVQFEIVKIDDYTAARERVKTDAFDIVSFDEAWIPTHATELLEFHASADTRKAFVTNLLQVSEAELAGKTVLTGLPIIGNFQSLIYQDGPVKKCIEAGSKLPFDNRGAELLQLRTCLKDTQNIAQPIVLKNTALSFWEILRAHGNQDRVLSDGTVVISAEAVKAAYTTLTTIESDVAVEKQGPAMSIGMPTAEERGKLVTAPLAQNPVLGMWLLGVRKNSGAPELATKIVTEIATDTALQTQLGSVPVLDAMPLDPVVKFNLMMARPRPRLVNWSEIEALLMTQLRAAKFQDVPSRLKFD